MLQNQISSIVCSKVNFMKRKKKRYYKPFLKYELYFKLTRLEHSEIMNGLRFTFKKVSWNNNY